MPKSSKNTNRATVRTNNKISVFKDFYKFCDKFAVSKVANNNDEYITNYCIERDETKAYKIDYGFYNQFLEFYSNFINTNHEIVFTEKVPDITYLKVHLQFNSQNKVKRPYTRDFIKKMVNIYINVFKKILIFKEVECYLCERDLPIKLDNGEYMYELELNFTNIVVSDKLAEFINLYVMLLAEKNKCFGKTFKYNQLVKNIYTVYSKSDTFLYGSRTKFNKSPYVATVLYYYQVSNIYGVDICEMDKIENLLIHTIEMNLYTKSSMFFYVNLFSVRQGKTKDDLNRLNEFYRNGKELDQLYFDLRKKYTGENLNKIENGELVNSEPCKEYENVYNEQESPDSSGLFDEYSYYSVNKMQKEEDFIMMGVLLKLINNKKRNSDTDCNIIGNCLHNLDDRFLNEWIIYCQHNSRFNAELCREEWQKFQKTDYGIITIHYMAKEDNLELYNKIREPILEKLYDNIMEIPEHAPIAKLIYEELKFSNKCVNMSKKEWYRFCQETHKWEIDREGNFVYSYFDKIAEEIKKRYGKHHQLMALSLDCTNEQIAELTKKKNTVEKLLKSLNKGPFRKSVVEEASRLLLDESFEEKKDENKSILGFTNGVYDFNYFVFRNGMPEDYITMNTGYNYIPLNKNTREYIDVMNFMDKIMPDSEMQKYLLSILSSCLTGHVSDESFYVFTGSGANGKSKLMELMNKVLGSLFKPMDVRIITEKRGGSSAASPDLADKKGIRLCPLDEPNHTDEINTGFMKFFTGGDKLMARLLFSNPIYFKPQFKPFLLCNKLPQIKSDDDGTWRRVKVIEFGSKFWKHSDFPKNPKKTDFLADSDLSNKLQRWTKVFCGILIDVAKEVHDNGGQISIPPSVLSRTNDYKLDSDHFKDFMNDRLAVDDEDKLLSLDKLYDEFVSWYRKNYANKPPTKKEMKSYFRAKVDKYNSSTDCLLGYIIKFEDMYSEKSPN